MTISTGTYYRNEVTIVRSVALSTPTVTAGNQVTIVDDVPTATSAPVRQTAEIETTVSYTATFRKRRLLLDIDLGPVTSTPAVSRNLVWNGRNLVWSSKQLVWT